MERINRYRSPSESPDLSLETCLWDQGIKWVAGLDEAGRGALAGPVVAGAVVFEAQKVKIGDLDGVRDSKQLTSRKRAEWGERLREIVWAWGIGFATQEEIDRLGIAYATQLAMKRSLENMDVPIQHLLIDFIYLPELSTPQTSIIKGDACSMSIAAASILAKTARDAALCAYDSQFPGYGFAQHKGYGTAAHLLALERAGPCAIHRKSFEPIKSFYNSAKWTMRKEQ